MGMAIHSPWDGGNPIWATWLDCCYLFIIVWSMIGRSIVKNHIIIIMVLFVSWMVQYGSGRLYPTMSGFQEVTGMIAGCAVPLVIYGGYCLLIRRHVPILCYRAITLCMLVFLNIYGFMVLWEKPSQSDIDERIGAYMQANEGTNYQVVSTFDGYKIIYHEKILYFNKYGVFVASES